jgi:mono/diheme cytochrome c family protein
MTRALLAGWLCLAAAVTVGVRLGADRQPPRPRPSSSQPIAPARSAPVVPPVFARAVLDQYCVSCHNQTVKTAGLALDALDVARPGDHVEVWEKVARKLRTHEMPPPRMPRPDPATYRAVTAWLESALEQHALARPNPGRVAVHRLSRTEYSNAIRDLLGLEVDGRALLHADEPDQQSFDNIASVLSVSPALLENYLSAAYKVSKLAVADRAAGPAVATYPVPRALVQDDQTSANLPFGSQGGTSIRHYFPVDGEYTIKVALRRQLYLYIIGMGEAHELDVRIDGARVGRFTVGGEGKGGTAPESFAGNTQGDPAWEVYMHTADAGLEVRVPVTAGAHEVGVSFVRRYWEPEGVLQPPQRGFARTTNELYHGNPAVDSVAIAGPYGVSEREAPSQSLSRRTVFVCSPNDGAGADPSASRTVGSPPRRRSPAVDASEDGCARRTLTALATRAYRRPVADAEVQTLLEFYRDGRAEGGFETGVQRGLERILAAPSFLFRIERAPAGLPAGTPYRLSDLDLASRLSFFLWSSIPDEALLNAAIRGTLSRPAVLDQHVRRMLRDSRARALVDNFAMQWLKLGKIAGVVPDVDAFPDFDENLRDAMLQETRLFIGSQLREDRSVTELLTANYSFLNERLAQHYRIADIYGSHFRRVTFDDGIRGGLLGQASVLTVTSYPNRTSPVLRGKWLLDNILGSPPPAPPPDVPSLAESVGDRPLSVREQMEAHRKNPACAVCHVRMDPLGFSLEHFDALGKWRTVSDGQPIDATATLPDGTEFQGVAGLRTLLANQREDFVRTFTEKLMAYAVGRGVEYDDLAAVRMIEKRAAAANYRWSALIAGIVRSVPFSMSRVQNAPSQPRVASGASVRP